MVVFINLEVCNENAYSKEPMKLSGVRFVIASAFLHYILFSIKFNFHRSCDVRPRLLLVHR